MHNNILPPPRSPETKRFWEASQIRQLLLGHCVDCGQAHYYPRAHCPFCLSAAVELRQASGEGQIFAFTVMRRAAVPYACGYIALAEGPKMFTQILCEDFAELATGAAVTLAFLPYEGGQLPVFQLVVK